MVGRDKFGVLIEELGKVIDLPLTPDKNNACLLLFREGAPLHIQFDPAIDSILIASEIGSPTQGRYREAIFKEALKSNGLPPSDQKKGFFAYATAKDALVLYYKIGIDETNAPLLATLLFAMKERADSWKNSIERGDIPSFTDTELSFNQQRNLGMFGLK